VLPRWPAAHIGEEGCEASAPSHANFDAAAAILLKPSVHPLGGKELRALRKLQRETPDGLQAVHVFVSERLAPLSVAGYQRMVARAGDAAGFPFLVHSHMLRHSTGYKLANDGQDTRAIQHYLGHRSIASTVRYTALAPDRFKGFWKD
jgi:site-specific recombinase XerD